MLSHVLRKIQTLAAVGALSLCAVSNTSAGLFCGCGAGQTRPYYSPACEPTWGYHQTCWRQFPPLEPCSGWGDYCPTCDAGGGIPISADGYQNVDGQLIPSSPYATQQFAQPQYAPQQSPASPPVVPGTPMMIPQPGSNYATPMNPGPGYPVPMNSAPGFGAPMGSSNVTPMPAAPQPIPQSQDFLPTPDVKPPAPDSTHMLPSPGQYRQSSRTAPGLPTRNATDGQQTWQQNNQLQPNVYPTTSQAPQPQNLAAQNVSRPALLRNISFSRVRPTIAKSATPETVETPKRSFFSRLWPGNR